MARLALATAICSAASLALTSSAVAGGSSGCHRADPGAERLSCQAVAQKEWRDNLVGVNGRHVYADSVTVEGNTGEVVNPDGLLRRGGGTTKLTTTAAGSSSLIVDLGRLTMGNVELGVENASGAQIRVAHSQFRQHLTPEGDGVCCSFGTDDDPESRADLFDAPSGQETLRTPGKRETRYLLITLDGPGTVTIDFVRTEQTTYPVEYDGHFLSSDELLNRAWYNSAHTGDLATVTQDGSPWMLTVTFDRVLFMGDLHMQAIAGYNQSSDYWMLTRNTLAQFGCIQNPDGSFPLASSPLVRCKPGNPGPADGWRWPEEGPDPRVVLGSVGPFTLFENIKIDSFTAFWVSGLADYYRQTGDWKFVKPLLPVARRAVDFFTNRTIANGLHYEPDDDTPFRANWHPLDTAHGVDSFTNAAYYDALKGLALLEKDVAHRHTAAHENRQLARRVRAALVDHLWDEDVDAMILNDQDPTKDHTGDANAGNLMFKTLDREHADSVLAYLDDGPLATPWGTRSSEFEDNPFMQSYIHGYINSQEALGRVRYGDGEGSVDLVRRWWGHMLANGPGTGWFVANNDGSVEPGMFANTAWTTALPALSEGLLGITPIEPGFERWRVAPQPSGLQWAQGRVPVPSGGISARWKRTAQGFVLTVEAPRNDDGEVVVPFDGAPRAVAMDGKTVWRPSSGDVRGGVRAERRGDTVVISGVRGSHTFAWAN